MKLPALASAVLFAATLAAANAASASEFCPPTAVPAETAPAPEGWRAWRTDESATYKLADVTFTDGPPEERAFLAPSSTAHRGAGRVDSYDFTSSTLRDIWIVCQYRDTRIALVRNTDLHGQRCQASYAKKGQASELASFVCR